LSGRSYCGAELLLPILCRAFGRFCRALSVPQIGRQVLGATLIVLNRAGSRPAHAFTNGWPRNPGENRPCSECRQRPEFIAYACWAGSTSPPHRLKPLARPCAFLLAARLGRAEVKTTRRLATRHGDGPSTEKTKRARRLGPRASISQAVRARRNPSPRTRAVAAMASEASGDGVQMSRSRCRRAGTSRPALAASARAAAR
jgi:hypothetical protein